MADAWSHPGAYTVGWICILPAEYVAACEFLDQEHPPLESVPLKDNNHYKLGRIGRHNVVIAVLSNGRTGHTSAAAVATDMLRTFTNVRFGLLVGTGGGAPSVKNDIRLGDVVVSLPGRGSSGVVQYDYGKSIQAQDFILTGVLNMPHRVLLTALTALRGEHARHGNHICETVAEVLARKPQLATTHGMPSLKSDRLYRSDVLHPFDRDGTCSELCGQGPARLIERPIRGDYDDSPAVHYGVIASANSVMKDALLRDSLAKSHRVLCFEMEAAGLMNQFPCLVIRGICNYSDTHKNNEWRGYAAMTAAAYAKSFLKVLIPRKVEILSSTAEPEPPSQAGTQVSRSIYDETSAAVDDPKSRLTLEAPPSVLDDRGTDVSVSSSKDI